MPFTYEAPTPRFAATIAEMIAHAADPQARAIEQIGSAHAQAIQQSGNAWAQAGQQIGQSIGQIPQQIQKQQEASQESQIRAQQIQSGAMGIAEQQKKLADEETMNRIYQRAYGQAPDQQPGYMGPHDPRDGSPSLPPGVEKGADGVFTVNPEFLTRGMAASGLGDKIPATIANLAKTSESMATLQKTRGEVAIQTRDALGSLAATVEASGNSPGAFHLAALIAIKNGILTPGQVKPYLDAADAEPAKIADITKSMQAGSPKQTELNSAAATAAARQKTAETSATRLDLETPKIAADTKKALAELEGSLPMTAAQKAANDVALQNLGVSQANLGERVRHDKIDEAHSAATAGANALTRVEHKDPATGKTVIEWLPKSSLAGQTFEKGTSGATETRLASAEAVNQTGKDIISKLSSPEFAAKVGPLMGRAGKLRDLIGNPPPEFAELAGEIESYALASMGVHGMRSAQGAAQITKLLDQHHTPQSLIAAINGLNSFSENFMKNEGRQVPQGAQPAAPETGAFPTPWLNKANKR